MNLSLVNDKTSKYSYYVVYKYKTAVDEGIISAQANLNKSIRNMQDIESLALGIRDEGGYDDVSIISAIQLESTQKDESYADDFKPAKYEMNITEFNRLLSNIAREGKGIVITGGSLQEQASCVDNLNILIDKIEKRLGIDLRYRYFTGENKISVVDESVTSAKKGNGVVLFANFDSVYEYAMAVDKYSVKFGDIPEYKSHEVYTEIPYCIHIGKNGVKDIYKFIPNAGSYICPFTHIPEKIGSLVYSENSEVI